MIVATITAKADHKEALKKLGFRWHSRRRNWFRFGELNDYEKLYALCFDFWLARPGEILFKVFNGSRTPGDPSIPF